MKWLLFQILAVIPGCFFTLARSILLLDDFQPCLRPESCHRRFYKVAKIFLSCILGLIAYGSLVPAIFWSLIWKTSSVVEDFLDWKQESNESQKLLHYYNSFSSSIDDNYLHRILKNTQYWLWQHYLWPYGDFLMILKMGVLPSCPKYSGAGILNFFAGLLKSMSDSLLK